jgi:hypothetical protein
MHRVAFLTIVLLLVGLGAASPRSWSYHYNPESAASSTAQVLKQAIIAELARDATTPNETSASGNTRIVGLLAGFDRMNSTDDLRALADLSGYFLGIPAETLYDCLALRKGPALKPYLAQAPPQSAAACEHEGFLRPNAALGGRAICVTSSDQAAHVTALIDEIDAGRSCSNTRFATLTANR